MRADSGRFRYVPLAVIHGHPPPPGEEIDLQQRFQDSRLIAEAETSGGLNFQFERKIRGWKRGNGVLDMRRKR